MPSRCDGAHGAASASTTPCRASTSSTASCAVLAAGDHVARVLLVARRVGDDELAPRRREVAVRDVDRDALLALGDEAVGQQRRGRRARPRRLRDVRSIAAELVGEDRLRVVQQPADQRALAVVDAAGGEEAQHAVVDPVDASIARHQKYPARLRSSIERVVRLVVEPRRTRAR